MVAESLAGPGGRQARAARIPPHARNAARRADGLEAAMVDVVPMSIPGLAPSDPRVIVANVAGPAALLVAKLHKIAERRDKPDRLVDKDAHDVYRLLGAVSTEVLARKLRQLRVDPLAGPATAVALGFLEELFGAGMNALGASMAGRAEEGIGDPDSVAAAAATLARDLLDAVDGPDPT